MVSSINAKRTMSDVEQRMLNDENFFNVTSNDVTGLCTKMLQKGYPIEEVHRTRTKYWDYFTDREKEMMQELGLSYEEQNISKRGPTMLINGFTVSQWKMLTVDDCFPPRHHIQRFMNLCTKNGDEDTVNILREKYRSYFDELKKASAANILVAHGLPVDTPYKTISAREIDGLSFFTWKLLNIDGYVPSNKSVLVSKWRQYENSGNYEMAARLEEKYFDLLHPEAPPPTEDAILDAEEMFLKMFPNNTALREKTEADRAKRKARTDCDSNSPAK